MPDTLSRRRFIQAAVMAGAAVSIVSARPGEAAPGNTIVYIHGLENKPPPDKKKEWCFEALAEGLKRNTGQTLHADFAVAYWADLRYERPDDTAAQPGRRAAAGSRLRALSLPALPRPSASDPPAPLSTGRRPALAPRLDGVLV
jgi:hypothetical protein